MNGHCEQTARKSIYRQQFVTNISQASDADLLELLLGNAAVKRLYRGSLRPFFSDTDRSGNANVLCSVAKELVLRSLKEDLQRDCALSSPGAVRDFLKLHFAGRQHESFAVLFLDAQNRLISASDMFRGTLTQTSVYPREVVKEALRFNAAAVIVAHNHPSGVETPSPADKEITKELKKALALVDVRVLDHFVVAGATTLSFAEHGLL